MSNTKKYKNLLDVWERQRCKILILVISAEGLTGIGKKSGTSSPFVKISVGKTTATTNIQKKTLSPKFDELFYFECGNDYKRDQLEIVAEVRSKTMVNSAFLGTVSIKLSQLKPELIHDNNFILKERSKKKEKIKIGGKIRLRIYYSELTQLRPQKPWMKFDYHYEKAKFKTGDLIYYSGVGIVSSVTKVLYKTNYSHLGMVLELPNKYTEKKEYYLIEITHNIDGMVDPFSEYKKRGVVIYRLYERLHQIHGGEIAISPLKKELDTSQLQEMLSYLLNFHAESGSALHAAKTLPEMEYLRKNFPCTSSGENFYQTCHLNTPSFLAKALQIAGVFPKNTDISKMHIQEICDSEYFEEAVKLRAYKTEEKKEKTEKKPEKSSFDIIKRLTTHHFQKESISHRQEVFPFNPETDISDNSDPSAPSHSDLPQQAVQGQGLYNFDNVIPFNPNLGHSNDLSLSSSNTDYDNRFPQYEPFNPNQVNPMMFQNNMIPNMNQPIPFNPNVQSLSNPQLSQFNNNNNFNQMNNTMSQPLSQPIPFNPNILPNQPPGQTLSTPSLNQFNNNQQQPVLNQSQVNQFNNNQQPPVPSRTTQNNTLNRPQSNSNPPLVIGMNNQVNPQLNTQVNNNPPQYPPNNQINNNTVNPQLNNQVLFNQNQGNSNQVNNQVLFNPMGVNNQNQVSSNQVNSNPQINNNPQILFNPHQGQVTNPTQPQVTTERKSLNPFNPFINNPLTPNNNLNVNNNNPPSNPPPNLPQRLTIRHNKPLPEKTKVNNNDSPPPYEPLKSSYNDVVYNSRVTTFDPLPSSKKVNSINKLEPQIEPLTFRPSLHNNLIASMDDMNPESGDSTSDNPVEESSSSYEEDEEINQLVDQIHHHDDNEHQNLTSLVDGNDLLGVLHDKFGTIKSIGGNVNETPFSHNAIYTEN